MARKKKSINWITVFNNKFALYLTLGVSSIWAFYVFVIFGLAPLVWPKYEENILYWSNFLQLIFLPVITVGSNILGKTAREQAVQDHKNITKELKLMQDTHCMINEHIERVRHSQKDIIEKLDSLTKKSS